MAEFKLYYFDVRSRCEPIRLLLEYGGIKYEDYRIGMDDWPAMKPKMPMAQMPVLECLKTHKQLSQTLAISKFVAEKAGLAGKDPWESAQCLMFACGVIDQWNSLGKVYMQKMAGDTTKEKANWLEFKKETLTPFLEQYTKFLEQSGTGWLVGKSCTWADIATGEYLSNLQDSFSPDALDGYPKLKELATRVMSQPQLKGYVGGRRPKTIF